MDQRNQHKPLTLYTFGDSILDCDHDGLTPGRLLVRNDDQVFPEFRGLDLASRGPVRLEQRASGGTTIETLHEQAHGLMRDRGEPPSPPRWMRSCAACP
jgi:hypothetical protein